MSDVVLFEVTDRVAVLTLNRPDRLMGGSLQAPDFVEGARSFVERREPAFAPLSPL